MGTELSNSYQQEAKVSEQKGEEADSSQMTCVLVHADNEVPPANKSLEDGLISPGSAKAKPGSSKSKKKKVLELPRRASKRLAGLEVDPVPELKPRTRARRDAGKQSGNGVAGTDEGSSYGNSAQGACQQPSQLEIKLGIKCTAETSNITELSRQSNKIKHFSDNLVKSETRIGKVETITNCGENQGCHVLSLENQNSLCERRENVETDDKADMKLGGPLDLPLGELLTDPCIAFAIKTLTGINFDSSECSEVLPGSISSEYSSANMATEIFKVETDNNVDRKQGCSPVLSSGSLPVPEELSEANTRVDEKSKSPFVLPFEGSWQDPCIEFAIKTLTEDIPVNYDPSIQHYFQQQLSSARTGGSDDTSMTSVAINNFCQTEYSCQRFSEVEKPGLTQQHEAMPAFPHSRTVSVQNSRLSVRNQHGNERQ
ncbi:Methyl-CpG-binding domain-containing protein [Trema orientale]|uniref:Methyl-CpG-binding domain-containing protein n=1 Tax=Trema orientale TaxID=63057 RepID=A0A2P5CZE9_TREOI|nr:Methyl-CpG-binding domain-containing protein [Trema orientale]